MEIEMERTTPYNHRLIIHSSNMSLHPNSPKRNSNSISLKSMSFLGLKIIIYNQLIVVSCYNHARSSSRNGEWGIGEWGLGNGDWGLSIVPPPKSVGNGEWGMGNEKKMGNAIGGQYVVLGKKMAIFTFPCCKTPLWKCCHE